MSTFAEYEKLQEQLDRHLAEIASRPDIAAETEHYLRRIGSVTSVDEFLSDDRVLRYAMVAFGLDQLALGKAFMRNTLLGGVDGRKAFVLQLVDPRLQEFASTFAFEPSQDIAGKRTQVAEKYVRMELEAAAGRTSEGLQLALYFQRMAPAVSGIYGLMGDPSLATVVRVALALPRESFTADIAKHVSLIVATLDLQALKEPAKMRTFIGQFARNWDLEVAAKVAIEPRVSLGRGPLAALSAATLQSLESLKLTGAR